MSNLLRAKDLISLGISLSSRLRPGGLKGLFGRMSIVIADGKHSYEFDYAIAAEAP